MNTRETRETNRETNAKNVGAGLAGQLPFASYVALDEDTPLDVILSCERTETDIRKSLGTLAGRIF